MEEKICIRTEFIKLDSLLKLAGEAPSGGEAKELIAAGRVFVNGAVCEMRGKKIRPGDVVRTGNREISVYYGKTL